MVSQGTWNVRYQNVTKYSETIANLDYFFGIILNRTVLDDTSKDLLGIFKNCLKLAMLLSLPETSHLYSYVSG